MITTNTTDREAIQLIKDQLDRHEFLIDPDDIRSILKRFEAYVISDLLNDLRIKGAITSLPKQEERLYSESEQL